MEKGQALRDLLSDSQLRALDYVKETLLANPEALDNRHGQVVVEETVE